MTDVCDICAGTWYDYIGRPCRVHLGKRQPTATTASDPYAWQRSLAHEVGRLTAENATLEALLLSTREAARSASDRIDSALALHIRKILPGGETFCDHCAYDDYPDPWPCPTVAALRPDGR